MSSSFRPGECGRQIGTAKLSRRTVLLGAAGLVLLGCGNEVNNGLPTYGSAKLQGFVSQSDGTPLADTEVFASFGPDAFGLRARTDRRGLYAIQGVSRQPIDEPPFDDGLILSRLIVGPGLADTLIILQFAATNQVSPPVTVNFVVDPP